MSTVNINAAILLYFLTASCNNNKAICHVQIFETKIICKLFKFRIWPKFTDNLVGPKDNFILSSGYGTEAHVLKVAGLDPSTVYWTDIFHLICCLFEKTKINKKEAGCGSF